MRIGPFGVNWYAADSFVSASCASGMAYSRRTLVFVGIELERQVAVLDDVELLELVEEREQVERHLIEGKRLEGAVEHAARLGFVAGAHQVEAEIALGANVGGRQLDGAARQRHGLVEAIVARGEIAGDAIDLAEGRIDRQDALRLGLERRLVVAHVGDRAEQSTRVEVRRVGLENASMRSRAAS